MSIETKVIGHEAVPYPAQILNELPPCPFCGCAAMGMERRIHSNESGWIYSVICAGCDSVGPWAYTADAAAEKWRKPVLPELVMPVPVPLSEFERAKHTW